MESGDSLQEDMFNVGKIIGTHGINGEVKVLRISDFDERFLPEKTVYAATDSFVLELKIDSHRTHKGFDLIRFEGYDAIDDVEPFKGTYLQIHASQLTNLAANAYYYHEIIGCVVYTDKEEKVGHVKEILTPGANDVWVVEPATGKDILIPYIADVVKWVDVSGKQIIITPMEGLLD